MHTEFANDAKHVSIKKVLSKVKSFILVRLNTRFRS